MMGGLQHLEPVGIWIIFGIDADGIVPVNLSPAFNTWDNRRFPRHRDRLFHPSGESRSDDAFVDKDIPLFQLAFGKPLRHPGRSTGAARRPVYSLVPVKHGIP